MTPVIGRPDVTVVILISLLPFPSTVVVVSGFTVVLAAVVTTRLVGVVSGALGGAAVVGAAVGGGGVVVTVVSMYVVSGRSVVANTVGSGSLFPERSTKISVSSSTALSPELSESGGP